MSYKPTPAANQLNKVQPQQPTLHRLPSNNGSNGPTTPNAINTPNANGNAWAYYPTAAQQQQAATMAYAMQQQQQRMIGARQDGGGPLQSPVGHLGYGQASGYGQGYGGMPGHLGYGQASGYAGYGQTQTQGQGQGQAQNQTQKEEVVTVESRIAKKPPVSKGLFAKDLKEIMFGLGDEAPAPDTVSLMEDILIEYLHEMITTAGQTSAKTLQADDLRRALQGPGDERKLARLEELILLQVEIKKARAINGLEARGLAD